MCDVQTRPARERRVLISQTAIVAIWINLGPAAAAGQRRRRSETCPGCPPAHLVFVIAMIAVMTTTIMVVVVLLLLKPEPEFLLLLFDIAMEYGTLDAKLDTQDPEVSNWHLGKQGPTTVS